MDFPKRAKRWNEIKLRVLVIARYSFLFFGITSNPLDRWYVVSFIEIDRCAHPRRYLCTCLAFYHRARLIFPTTPRASGDNQSPAASSRRVSPFLRRDTKVAAVEMQWRCNSRMRDAFKLQCIKKEDVVNEWKKMSGVYGDVSHKIRCHLVLI